MVSTDAFPVPELLDLDASSALDDLGPVGLHSPSVDLDGDGTADTSTLTRPDALVVLTDGDLDGQADHLTVVDDSGEFATWQYDVTCDGTAHWTEIAHGRVGE